MRTLLLIFILVLSFAWAKAQDWKPLGPSYTNQPSPGYASNPSFSMDSQGNLFVGYQDYRGTYGPTVRKYDGNIWGPVGPQGFADSFNPPEIAVAPDGTPWATDVGNSMASKFNGTSWVVVGTTAFQAAPRDIAIDPTGIVYVAAIDNDHNQKASVFKLVGNSWERVGNPGFTAVPVQQIQIEIAPDGSPYVSCTVHPGGYKSIIMKLNDTTWETVGHTGIWEGVGSPQLAIAKNNTLYLAYSDSLNDYKATVMKLNGTDWEAVGDEGFSAGAGWPDIAIDPSGIPFVAFRDNTIGRKPRVMKFTGTNWETVGNAGFSNSDASGVSILIDPSGIPYVAYADVYISVDEFLEKVRVVKLTDNTWVSVGSAGISGGLDGASSLVIAPNGTPYMAHGFDSKLTTDLESWHKTRVTKWNGNTWEKVGNPDHYVGIEHTTLAVDPEGTLYMSYSDSAIGYKTTVVKLVDNNWETVGSEGFAESFAVTDLAVDSTGTPYVAYSDVANEHKVTVKRFNGSTWETVGTAGISEGMAFPLIAFNKEGTPYVAFSDGGNENKMKVMKFEDNTWESISSNEIHGGDAYPLFLAIDTRGKLYIAYSYNGRSRTEIETFDGTTWVSITGESFPMAPTISSFVLDAGGTPYIAYADEANNFKVTVTRYDGNSWEPVSDIDFIQNMTDPTLAVDKMGNLYLVIASGGIWAYKYESSCTNPTSGGVIAGNQSDCESFDPVLITSTSLASGHEGILEYKWQKSTTGSGSGFTDINHNAQTYDPGAITQTTWFRRLARVNCTTGWTEAAKSNVVVMKVIVQPEIVCPQDETVNTDPGVTYARKTYRAVAEGVADTVVVYLVNGKAITFPYDFPIGTTTVEVKANNECATAPACSFKVTVRQATGIEDLDTTRPFAQVYPNPFTREMAIEIANPSLKEVSAEIFSMSGQKIRTLAKAQKGLRISLTWNGTNEQGEKVPYGLYLLKVNKQTRKVMYGQ